MEEAHKAYYLFLNPSKRGVFSTGIALRGKDIIGIFPDYNATMGWNADYTPKDVDWAEIERKGVDKKCQKALYKAKQLGEMQKGLQEKLSSAVQLLPESSASTYAHQIADVKRIDHA